MGSASGWRHLQNERAVAPHIVVKINLRVRTGAWEGQRGPAKASRRRDRVAWEEGQGRGERLQHDGGKEEP